MNINNSEAARMLAEHKERLTQHLLDAIEELTCEDAQSDNRIIVNDLAFIAKTIMLLEYEEGGEQ